MESKSNDEITLSFTREEANLIIEGLGALPFKNVYKLIEKIHLQANSKHSNAGTRNDN